MDIRKLTPDLSVSRQLLPEDVLLAKEAGFKSILCNRPDGERDDQPAFSEIAAAAEAAGIEILHQPIIMSQMTQDHVEAFSKNVQDLPSPVLAYCASGTRCTLTWALGAANTVPVSEVIGTAANAGYDLRQFEAMLESAANT